MSKTSRKSQSHVMENASPRAIPSCLAIAQKGIKNSADLIRFFSACICDVAEERLSANRANAMNGGGRVILKAAELEIRYGLGQPGTAGRKTLTFSPSIVEGKTPAALEE